MNDNTVTVLPDGSAFATASFPLPKDHWLFQRTDGGYSGPPPMPALIGEDDYRRVPWEEAVTAAARYAIRAATMCGQEEDFDPDALVQNMVVGLLGYHTADGLGSEAWENPSPVPISLLNDAVYKSLYYTVLYEMGIRYKGMLRDENLLKVDFFTERAGTASQKIDDLKAFIDRFLDKVIDEYPIPKLCRWIGNIQGKLDMLGITTDEAEQEWSRPKLRPLDFPPGPMAKMVAVEDEETDDAASS